MATFGKDFIKLPIEKVTSVTIRCHCGKALELKNLKPENVSEKKCPQCGSEIIGVVSHNKIKFQYINIKDFEIDKPEDSDSE